MEYLIFCTCIIIILVRLWYYRRGLGNLPPGPYPLPLVGSLYLLWKKNPLDVFRRLHKQYGDVYNVKVGHINLIVFNGYQTLREALVKRADEFSDRPAILSANAQTKGLGVVNSSGYIWKHTRTFALGALRDYGFGKRSMEGKIMEEVHVFLDIVLKSDGAPMTMNKTIHTSISNVICNIIFGNRFEHNDPDFQKLLEVLNQIIKQSGGFISTAINALPIVKYFPVDISGRKAARARADELRRILHQTVVKHLDTIDYNNPRDFVDEFLIEKRKQGNSENIVFSDENLRTTIIHLFAAGTETTSTTLCWAVLQLLHNPHIQERMRKEIEDVVGFSRDITLDDKDDMPYCEAVIIETLRWANIAPIAIPHGTPQDITFRGYMVPKESVLIMNLDSVMRDPDLFENPDEFNPNRFVGNDGKLQGHEKVIAFSLGRRICLGERLARMELFLFLTSLVQRFRLFPVDNKNLPTLEGIFGFTHNPHPYHFRAANAQ